MTTFIHSLSLRHVLCIDNRDFENILDLKLYLQKTKGIPVDSYFLTCNGSIVDNEEPVQEHTVYHTYLKILGGKGGFGSMLRAIGAQIEKTTNHEACRDLSGRRMRDVNYEKDLKEWAAKKAEKEHEKEVKRQERIARRRAMPNHKFDDPLYEKQRELLSENQEDALQKGLQRVVAGPSTESVSVKRKAETVTSADVKRKKATEWSHRSKKDLIDRLGLDMDMSDLDSEEDETNSGDEQKSSEATEETLPGVGQIGNSDTGPSTSTSGETCEGTTPISISEHEQDCNSNQENSFQTSGSNICIDNDKAQMKDLDKEGKSNENLYGDSVSVTASGSKEDSTTHKINEDENETNKERKFCLDEMKDIDQVLSFGMDVLKEELMSRGLKCGGTLQQRALRLFSVKGLALEEIDSALFAKANGKNGKNSFNKK